MTTTLTALENFQRQIKEAAAQDRASYFLVHVEKVAVGTRDPNNFQVQGKRLDNGQTVQVVTRKSNTGQHVPSPGMVMRADKTSRVSSRNPEIPCYSANYFHTYGEGSLCLHGLMRANRPYQRDDQIFASVDVIDLDARSKVIRTPAEFDQVILALLRPWRFQQGPLVGDAAGRQIWPQHGLLGVQPMVLLRLCGQENGALIEKGQIFGLGAVDRADGQTLPSPRLPTDQEILAQMRRSPSYEFLRGITEQPGFAEVGFVPIPGIRVNVGRDAISNGTEKYLGAPQAWNWVRRDLPADAEGKPATVRGWRGGILHVKETDKGRKIAVDAAPSAKWPLSQNPGSTLLERKLAGTEPAPVENKTQAPGASAKPAQAPSPAAQGAPVSKAPQVNALDDDYGSQHDAHQFEPLPVYSPDDIHAMEMMNQFDEGPSDAIPPVVQEADFSGFDDTLDDLLEEAQQQSQRRNQVPRM